jgi:hypothetical protein
MPGSSSSSNPVASVAHQEALTVPDETHGWRLAALVEQAPVAFDRCA